MLQSLFTELSKADDLVKSFYSDLKNMLLSYKSVKSRAYCDREIFYIKSKPVITIYETAGTLCIDVQGKASMLNGDKQLLSEIFGELTAITEKLKLEKRKNYVYADYRFNDLI